MRHLALAASLSSLLACSAAPPSDEVLDSDNDPGTEEAYGAHDPNALERGELGKVADLALQAPDVPMTALSAHAVTPQDWMSLTPGLSAQSLSRIFVPGTHDSGAYELESVYSRPLDDAFAPDDNGNLMIRLGQFVGVTELWSVTQERTIAEQLEDGMRYLDLRPCREKSGTIRICHGLYGPRMSDILDQIAAFAEAHPKEILVVQNGAFAGFEGVDHSRLADMYASTLGRYLIDHGSGVTPSSTLDEVWSQLPGRNIIVLYGHSNRPPTFWPTSTAVGSWVDTWDRAEKKASLEAALANATPSKFFLFSGAPTPDATLILRSFDPFGTYPRSLSEMADDTNPAVLGWLRDEWSTKQANLISIDFYNRTCLFALTQRLNGNLSVSLDGCDIGGADPWGRWRTTLGRIGYGRGAGTPLGCAPGEEKIGALCYPRCMQGYASNVAFPYLCLSPCPEGYRDDGLSCFRDAKIIGANNSACPWYDVCGLTFKKGCSTCPAGYTNDGCTCRRNPSLIFKSSYSRGAGVPLHACGDGEERSGLLCYPKCEEGFYGAGPMCTPFDE